MNRRLGVHRRSGRHEVPSGEGHAARDARWTAPTVPANPADVETFVVERESDRLPGRVERHDDAADAAGAARFQLIGDCRHGAVQLARRLVVVPLACQVEDGHALLLAVRARCERRMRSADHELVVVSQRRVREVVRFGDLESATVGRDAHTRAPHVPRLVFGRARKVERPSAHGQIDRGAARGLPAQIARIPTRAPCAARPSAIASDPRSSPGTNPAVAQVASAARPLTPRIRAPRSSPASGRRGRRCRARLSDHHGQGEAPGANQVRIRARPAAGRWCRRRLPPPSSDLALPKPCREASAESRRSCYVESPPAPDPELGSATIHVPSPRVERDPKPSGANPRAGPPRGREPGEEVVPPYGPNTRGASRNRHCDRERRDARHRRPVRRRQVDASPLHRDARHPHVGLDSGRRRRDDASSRARASPSSATGRSASSSSFITCCPSSTRSRTCSCRRSSRAVRDGSASRAHARCSKRSVWPTRHAPAGRALRRRGPARGARPRPHARAEAALRRRADRQPRLGHQRSDSRPFFAINRQRGTTIVVVTHNPALAESMPRVVSLRDGHVERDELR